jgi:hypothetical protein
LVNGQIASLALLLIQLAGRLEQAHTSALNLCPFTKVSTTPLKGQLDGNGWTKEGRKKIFTVISPDIFWSFMMLPLFV